MKKIRRNLFYLTGYALKKTSMYGYEQTNELVSGASDTTNIVTYILLNLIRPLNVAEICSIKESYLSWYKISFSGVSLIFDCVSDKRKLLNVKFKCCSDHNSDTISKGDINGFLIE